MSEAVQRAKAFLVMAGVGLILVVGVTLLFHLSRDGGSAEKTPEKTEDITGTEQVSEEPPGPVDLDATVRAMLELDVFVADSRDLDEYLRRSARQDWRRVAPDVRRARRAIVAQLEEISRVKAESKAHQGSWNWQRSMLSAARVLNLGGKASFTELSLDAGLDTAQAAQVSEEYAQHLLKGGGLDLQDLLAQARLKGLVQGYAESAFQHLKAWDELCAQRDQAMLAALNGHFDRAVEQAEKAIALSPPETEAHLLLAMALIEGGRSKLESKLKPAPEIEVEGSQEIPAEKPVSEPAEWARAEQLLEGLISRAPDRAAPARLLQGVLAAYRGRAGLARDRLEFASAHFPKQAQVLSRNLRALKARARYLSRSRAGLRILRAHSAMVQGAGYFSPDLQLAQLNFRDGDLAMGRKRVLDHFARRRAQRNWEFILSDLQYAYRAFGADFRSIFPAETFLELVPGETWFGLGEDMKIEVVNRSDQSLHNVTLVLCARFTDMMPDDYATLPLDTQEELPAGETVAFGTFAPRFRVHGGWAQGKMISDSLRAILVSDEAVIWVDTMAFRQKEHADVLRDLAKGLPRPSLSLSWLWAEPLVLAQEHFAGADMSVQRNAIIKDVLKVRLPAKAAVVRPMFRLLHGEGLPLKPDQYRLEKGKIFLEFNLDLDDPPERWTLLVLSPFVEYELVFERKDELSYGLQSVQLRAG